MNVLRIERSRRFLIQRVLDEADRVAFASLIHDRMTECVYDAPITTFTSGVKPESTFTGKKRYRLPFKRLPLASQ
jgi:phosphoribosylformylglycinamidine synthase